MGKENNYEGSIGWSKIAVLCLLYDTCENQVFIFKCKVGLEIITNETTNKRSF